MVLGTSDVQEAYSELSGRGVTFLQEPQEKPWGTDALFADTLSVKGGIAERLRARAPRTQAVSLNPMFAP